MHVLPPINPFRGVKNGKTKFHSQIEHRFDNVKVFLKNQQFASTQPPSSCSFARHLLGKPLSVAHLLSNTQKKRYDSYKEMKIKTMESPKNRRNTQTLFEIVPIWFDWKTTNSSIKNSLCGGLSGPQNPAPKVFFLPNGLAPGCMPTKIKLKRYMINSCKFGL